MTLTPMEREVLEHLALPHPLPPTILELMTFFRWKSTNSAAEYLDRLEKKGAIHRIARSSRARFVTAAGRKALKGG